MSVGWMLLNTGILLWFLKYPLSKIDRVNQTVYKSDYFCVSLKFNDYAKRF